MKKKNFFKYILLVPFVIAGAFTFADILHYGVNTPYWDEWEMVPLFKKVDHHTLGFNDLWRQHNEHRIFFPKIVLITAAYVTHWNVKAELLISFAFSMITALMLYLFVLQKIQNRGIALLTSVLCATWLYSPVQYENWLWGWQVEWFMCVAGIVTAFYLLDRFSSQKSKLGNWLFGGAVLSAIIATFSLGGGLVVWLVGLGILVAYMKKRAYLGLWSAAAILSTLAYYYHYHKPAASPPMSVFLHQRLNFIRYILGYIGRPVSGNPDVAILIGSILLLAAIPLAYLTWHKKAELHKFAPWLSLMAAGAIIGVLAAISRLGLGLDESLSSRYTAFSLLYIIGLTGLIGGLLDSAKLSVRQLTLTILVALSISAPLIFSSYANGRVGLRNRALHFSILKYCTHEPAPTRECLLSTYPNAKIAQSRLNYVKSKHWAGY